LEPIAKMRKVRLNAGKTGDCGFLELYQKVPNLSEGRDVCFVCHASAITGFATASSCHLWATSVLRVARKSGLELIAGLLEITDRLHPVPAIIARVVL
jgi:hypothetical protein